MEQQLEQPRTRRRIKLSANSHWQVAAIGGLAGLALVALGLRPTGSPMFDVIVLGGSAALVTWCACTAPWWLLVSAGAIATGINPLGAGTAIGLASIGLSAWVGLQQRSNPLVRAIAVALVMLSLAFVGNLFRLGISTAVGMILMIALAVTGLQRRPSADRRLAQNIVGGVAAVAVLVIAIAVFSGYQARSDLQSANRQANRGLRALRHAEFDDAATEFGGAANQFDRAHQKLAAPWMQPVRLIPIAAQQWRAAEEITGTAADVSLVVGENAASVDLKQLKINDGQIDIDAIRELQRPLEQVNVALVKLGDSVDDSQSPWLVPSIGNRLDALRTDIADQQRLGDNALEAVRLAPAILGENGERHYFVMFTTPAEARGQGGFMGSYAEVTANNGKIEVTTFGRTLDLNNAVRSDDGSSPVFLKAPPSDWMDAWGEYLVVSNDDRRAAFGAWSNINMSAHFPYTAQIIDELYPKSGGSEIDGVFSLDVYGVEALVGLVGPLQVEGSPRLTGKNTAQFILVDQYLGLTGDDEAEANAERTDMLGVIAEQGIDRLLTSNPPDPVQLGTAFAPLAQEGRVLGWSAAPEEEALFARIGLDGALVEAPASDDGGDLGTGVEVSINNALGNKIDSFLERTTVVDNDKVIVRFTNTAPGSGFPRYVIGNRKPDVIPFGTNRMILSVYSTEEVVEIAVNGEPLATQQNVEAGRHLYRLVIDIAPGTSTEIAIQTPSVVTAVIDQPLVKPAGPGSDASTEEPDAG